MQLMIKGYDHVKLSSLMWPNIDPLHHNRPDQRYPCAVDTWGNSTATVEI